MCEEAGKDIDVPAGSWQTKLALCFLSLKMPILCKQTY
jgi:hypothetical protein